MPTETVAAVERVTCAEKSLSLEPFSIGAPAMGGFSLSSAIRVRKSLI